MGGKLRGGEGGNWPKGGKLRGGRAEIGGGGGRRTARRGKRRNGETLALLHRSTKKKPHTYTSNSLKLSSDVTRRPKRQA